MTLTKRQHEMLRDLDRDGDVTDYADYSDRAGGALGWANRERVIEALLRRRLIDMDLRLTDAGREALA
jgi:hypothetical protein